MSNRKYLRVDGYHDRSPYNPYQSSGKYSTKQSSSIQSDSRSERSSNVNGGTGSRNNSPKARHSNLSPRSHRLKSSYSKAKELSKRGSSSSPVEAVSHHSSSSGDRMLKVDSISTDDNFPWSQHTSSSGKTYFYNCKTEKSQWEKPKEWIDRQKERERKKRDGKEKSDYPREHLPANHGSSSKERTREGGSKRDSQGNLEGKGDSSRDRIPFHSEENRRIPQYYPTNYQQASAQVTKTTSANTFAVSTTTHRPDQLSARPESTVSPSNSLQDISPPVTPSTGGVQTSSSPLVGSSPIVTTRSPVLLAQKSPIVQSPLQPRLPAVPHHGNSTTPPPPPPPLPTHSSQNLHGVSMQAHNSDNSYQNSPQMNVLSTLSTKLPDNSSFNGIHVLSQSHLHPLQQATLLQAQFQSSSNVRPMTSGIISASPPHFQPIKQSNSTPGSPLSFNTRLYPNNSPVQSQKSSMPYVAPQSINIQDFAPHFSRALISHTLGWPSEQLERQLQKLSDETFSLSSMNNRLKADLLPLNFHHNLTAMRMGVGAKRIEFLREQRKKLEASDWIS